MKTDRTPQKNTRFFFFAIFLFCLSVSFSYSFDFNETFSRFDYTLLRTDMSYMGFESGEWINPPSTDIIQGVVTNWYYGYWFAGGRGVNVTEMYINKDKSLRNIRDGSTARTYILYDLDYPVVMNNDTQFSYFLNGTAGTEEIMIAFINDTGCPYYFDSGQGLSFDSGRHIEAWCDDNVGYSNIGCLEDVVGGVDNSYINITLQTECGVADITSPFNKLAIWVGDNTATPFYSSDIDNIALSEFNYSTEINSLPECTIEWDNLICYEGAYTNMTIPINISCTDPEGNIIYYAQSLSDIFDRQIFYEEEFYSFDFFDSHNFIYDGEYSEDYNAAWRYITGAQEGPYILIGELSGNNILMVDNGVHNWSYMFNPIYPNQNQQITTSKIIGFPKDNTEISILFYDGFYEEFLNITLHQNNGLLNISIDGEDNGSFSVGLMTSEYSEYLVLSTSQGNGTMSVYLEDYDYTALINSQISKSDLGFSGFSFHSIDHDLTSQDFYVIDNLIVRGWNYVNVPSFSTTVPTSITIDPDLIGYNYRLYVSDSYHYPLLYREYQEYLTFINDCDADEVGEAFDQDGNIIAALQYFFRSLTDGMGVTSIFHAALWPLYICMLVFFIFSLKNFKVAWLFTNIIFMATSYLFGAIAQLISGIILLSMSIAVVVFLK